MTANVSHHSFKEREDAGSHRPKARITSGRKGFTPGLGAGARIDQTVAAHRGVSLDLPIEQLTGVKIYMRVSDLDAYLDKAEALSGKRLVPPTDLPGDYGRFAVFADPDGNAVGLWT